MFNKIQEIFSIPELKRRVLFTLGLLVVYRVGGHITTPGVDAAVMAEFFERQRGTILGLYDLFAGGNLEKATIFALGIMPYISASIILQLFQAVIPYFEKLAKEGDEGRKKITQYTRYGTVVLSVIQGFGIAMFLENMSGPSGASAVMFPGWGFRLLTVLTLTAGTVFVMWLGEQITERGIGNGISLIITIGIIARYPIDALNTLRAVQLGQMTPFKLAILLLVMVFITAAIIFVTQGQRRIPVQYAKRVVGRKVYGGQASFIPLSVNIAGVIPIIFAQSLIMFPGTIAAFFQNVTFLQTITLWLSPGHMVYIVLYSLIIIFFTYFYTAIVLNPVDLADNMKKSGGFIPGIRPGKRTAEYIDRILTRITLPGAIFLAFIAVLPDILIRQANVPFYFGGTGLLIVVGVMLDTLRQVESHLLMRHYEGFVKHGRLRGRRG
ncbi:MAG: preprotein translocase subunit SecY [Candidatus Krumholzibacteria bacterium]|nr:preprotein translocase subunit SecY [Candidatus Krumholzibacteria bacterium]MDH4338140.1 preprotein translocase subunit SecY [Candidatus Krumholzibacteria bacterium]MDH5270966.1 preprotein translocase subunit SecY [Candidatus Krumholzibacteria bacterium]MDH5627784.1 preprotein translocase subunit SecY [Candidatus Krumholzibacteria bacterium]